MKITVVGAGYVGLSNALLFSKQHDVMVFDIDKTRVKNINQRVSPISDTCIQTIYLNLILKRLVIKNRRINMPNWSLSQHPPTTTLKQITSIHRVLKPLFMIFKK